MKTRVYDRDQAVKYAKEWAFSRNPQYLNFHNLGGDCTNFASQCLHAGGAIMNRTKDTGWYYVSASNRAPAWTGVRFLNDFLTGNEGIGPYARAVPLSAVQPGDLIQLSNGRRYHHTLIVVRREGVQVFVAAHTYDAYDRALSSYSYTALRVLAIQGIRIPD